MNKLGRCIAVLGCVALLACFAVPRAAVADADRGQEIGVVAALVGTATVRAESSTDEAVLSLGDALRKGEVVRTGPDGRLKIALRDGSTLSLGVGTELRLQNLSLQTGAAEKPSLFTQLSGYIRALIAPAHPRAGFEIDTPYSVAAVRGTDWIQNCAAGAAQIFVAHGSVEIAGTKTHAGDRVVLRDGEGVTFSEMAPHAPVVRWKPAKIAAFVAATTVP